MTVSGPGTYGADEEVVDKGVDHIVCLFYDSSSLSCLVETPRLQMIKHD
jgi:hypothetical protein